MLSLQSGQGDDSIKSLKTENAKLKSSVKAKDKELANFIKKVNAGFLMASFNVFPMCGIDLFHNVFLRIQEEELNKQIEVTMIKLIEVTVEKLIKLIEVTVEKLIKLIEVTVEKLIKLIEVTVEEL